MWYKSIDHHIALFVKVIPGAAQTKVMGVTGNRLRIRIAAPPEDGKANQALLSFLAKQLCVSKQDIEITFGNTSPEKNLKIHCSVELVEKLVV